MNAIKKVVDQFLAWSVIVISTVLVACVVWQVFSRYCLGAPSVETDEIAKFMLMWMGLLGAAYASSLKRHLAIDLLAQKLTGRNKKISQAVIVLASIAFVSIVMIYGGGSLAIKTLQNDQLSAVLKVPMGWIYSAIPISGMAILFYCMLDIKTLFTHNNDSRLSDDNSHSNNMTDSQ